jgi:hypothetical protein
MSQINVLKTRKSFMGGMHSRKHRHRRATRSVAVAKKEASSLATVVFCCSTCSHAKTHAAFGVVGTVSKDVNDTQLLPRKGRY